MKLLNRLSFCILLLTLLLSGVVPGTLPHASAQAGRAFTTIRDIRVTPLSNGVQLAINSDGLLQYNSADTSGREMRLYFPDARNGTGKNFFNINSYPVSHIQLSTPQGAVNGIGLQLVIYNLAETNASLTRSANGQSVLFTIQSDRTIEGRRGAGAAAADAAPDTTTVLNFENNLLTLRAVRADIHQLVAGIARETGLAIAVDDAVNRKVSLNLNKLEPASAIRAIATANGLAISEINGIFMISEGVPTDLATYRLSGTQSYRMQNTQASTASGLLPNFLYSYVKVNSEQNAVVVTAPSQMLAKIGSDLSRMDVPSPQIAVEAIAVELSDSTTADLGLTIGSPDRTSFSQLSPSGGILSYNTIGKLPRLFEVNLRALELKGKARVRARPQMAVVNGRTADIFIGAQRFILTQFNQSGQTQTRIQPVDVGVKLRITPLTGGNGEITARIAPEVSNITELDLQTGLPVLSTRRAETSVRIRDGETIAIGGLTLNQEQETRGKIPFLGDLPLVGKLFHSRKNSMVRTELVVFVTPRIINAEAIAAQQAVDTPTTTTQPNTVAPTGVAPMTVAPTAAVPAVPQPMQAP
jgi:type IV pilus assembly protein PilQ